MNIKILFSALCLIGVFFVVPVVAFAQTTNPLVCCQFNAKDNNANEYPYCSMVKNCNYDSVNVLKVNNTVVIESSVNQAFGSCTDDYDNTIAEGLLGTHCKTDNSQTSTSTRNSCDGSLSECIASKMPNKSGGIGSNMSTTALIDAVSIIINTVLGLLGLIFTVILVYAGIQWIHYGGESDGKKKSSKRIKNAIIGLAITLSAYSLATIIINNLK